MMSQADYDAAIDAADDAEQAAIDATNASVTGAGFADVDALIAAYSTLTAPVNDSLTAADNSFVGSAGNDTFTASDNSCVQHVEHWRCSGRPPPQLTAIASQSRLLLQIWPQLLALQLITKHRKCDI